MTTVTIAPHLQRALEAMSKDMAVEPQALVNQAVFAWLRINGYVLPGAPAPVVAAPAAVAPPVAPVVAPVVAVTPPVPVVPVVVSSPVAPPPPPTAKSAASLAPVETAPVEPKASSPSGEQLAAVARMAQIAADLEKLTRPWPPWTKEEEAEQAPAPAEEDEEETAAAQPAAEESPDAPEEEAEEATPPAPVAEEEDLDANTGETEVEPPADSTVVLRSVPIALYLEREGEALVKVAVERFIIGRGPQCDLIIDSPRVSREHVALTRSGVQYFIEDLNSSNGTWFGEERVTKRELESGDVILLGNEAVTFILRAD